MIVGGLAAIAGSPVNLIPPQAHAGCSGTHVLPAGRERKNDVGRPWIAALHRRFGDPVLLDVVGNRGVGLGGLRRARRGAVDELVVLEVVGSAFLSSDPQPARARPSTTAMIAMPPALTFLIESPVSVEICAMSSTVGKRPMEGKSPRTPAIRRLSRNGRYTGLPELACQADLIWAWLRRREKMLMVSL